MYQQAKAECSRNQYGLAEILCRNPEYFKEFEVQEVMPTTQQLKEAFNMRMKDTSEEQPKEAPVSFWEVFDEFVKECGNQNNWTASTYENLQQ